MDDLLKSLQESIFQGQAEDAAKFTRQALEEKISAGEILEKGMIPAMDRIGEEFSKGMAYIPDLLVAARAMSSGMKILRGELVKGGVEPKGKVLLGTVFGDVHDIGKNLVKMTLEGAGFQVIDLGTDVSAEKFAAAYKQHHPDLIGLSALLSTTMNHMGEIIQKVREVNRSAKVIVGGAPIRQEFADKMGANGFAPDAPMAVKKAKEILGIR
jgi:5-methyltetrahydrofolate--homocysteine methyltransferase